MLRTLERILSMYSLGSFCCVVFQVGICEDVSSADILPKQVWKLSELCSPAKTSVDSAFYSPTDLRIAYPQQARICQFPPRVSLFHWIYLQHLSYLWTEGYPRRSLSFPSSSAILQHECEVALPFLKQSSPQSISPRGVSPQSQSIWSFWLPSQGSFAFCM
jgi:hypothetical protein